MRIDLVRIWNGGYAVRSAKLLRAGKPWGPGEAAANALEARRCSALNRVFRRMAARS